jgi:hypothetical protein
MRLIDSFFFCLVGAAIFAIPNMTRRGVLFGLGVPANFRESARARKSIAEFRALVAIALIAALSALFLLPETFLGLISVAADSFGWRHRFRAAAPKIGSACFRARASTRGGSHEWSRSIALVHLACAGSVRDTLGHGRLSLPQLGEHFRPFSGALGNRRAARPLEQLNRSLASTNLLFSALSCARGFSPWLSPPGSERAAPDSAVSC